jgi:hypothetical protein
MVRSASRASNRTGVELSREKLCSQLQRSPPDVVQEFGRESWNNRPNGRSINETAFYENRLIHNADN